MGSWVNVYTPNNFLALTIDFFAKKKTRACLWLLMNTFMWFIIIHNAHPCPACFLILPLVFSERVCTLIKYLRISLDKKVKSWFFYLKKKPTLLRVNLLYRTTIMALNSIVGIIPILFKLPSRIEWARQTYWK